MSFRYHKLLILAAFAVLAQLSALAGDVAVLRNGRSINHTRREQIGDTTRLYTAEGYVDIPTEQIVSFEPDDTPVAPQLQEAPQAQPQVPAAQPVAASSQVDLNQVVREASARRQLDPDFVNSVIKAESNFKTRAVSPKGAQGLMQLMPGTAAQLGVSDPFDPKANVEAGTRYLSDLLDLYHDDPIKALAAYNAGALRVEQYHGVPPYRETRAYVARIVRDFNAKKRAQMGASQVAAGKKAGTNNNVNKKTATARKTTTKKKLRQASAALVQPAGAASAP
ncbi:MAG TPA: lytic transglycosylase domain-containing protein [Candidatus Angelobacter sp.]